MFPAHIWTAVEERHPIVGDTAVRAEVDHALRDWFTCCAWRGQRALGMPSRLVDVAWHAFILDSLAYVRFCGETFGSYLHHFPESANAEPLDGLALVNTVWAWDRSDAGRDEESLMWDLDERHSVEEPWGIPELQLAAIRSENYAGGGEGWISGTNAACPPNVGFGGAYGGGDGIVIGGGDSGGGGGCGGGGGAS
jgi:hypothetical protein